MIRRARAEDAPAIHALIHRYAGQDLLLPRPLTDIYDRIRDFWVATDRQGMVVGCVAMRIWWHDLAEVRSLAVDPKTRRRGVGRALVEHCIEEARSLQIPKVFALTYQAEFFRRIGFERVDKAELPHKIWRDCLKCSKFPHCDETAVLKTL